MASKYTLAMYLLLSFVFLMAGVVTSIPVEELDTANEVKIKDHKEIPLAHLKSPEDKLHEDSSSEETTEEKPSSSTTTIQPKSDLERSDSDVVESKVDTSGASTGKDEKFGTSDSFTIGIASPNGIYAFDSPLLSGTYGGIPPYLGNPVPVPVPVPVPQAKFFPNQQFYGGEGFVGNPLIGGYNGGVGYGGFGAGQAGYGAVDFAQQQLLANKQYQQGINPYELQKSLKYGGRNPYGGVSYGGYGEGGVGGLLDDYGGHEFQQGIAVNKHTGIDSSYGNAQPFGATQYPINLNVGGFGKFGYPNQGGQGFGLNEFKQQQLLRNQFGGGGSGFGGGGYDTFQNNLAGFNQQTLLARRKGGFQQPDPYYYAQQQQQDPIYSSQGKINNYNSFQHQGGAGIGAANKFYQQQQKSPYGFYSGN